LLKIAEELALVKAELASLKSELDHIHAENARSGGMPQTAAAQPAQKPAQAAEPNVFTDEMGGTDEADGGADETTDSSIIEPQDNAVPETDGGDEMAEPSFDADFAVDSSVSDTDEDVGEDADGNTAVDEGAVSDEGFFDEDKSDEKITLTSDELDLLGEGAGETTEEMNDSFFADDADNEKIALSGDEMDDILAGSGALAGTGAETAGEADAAGDEEPNEASAEEPAAGAITEGPAAEAAGEYPDADFDIDLDTGTGVDTGITAQADETAIDTDIDVEDSPFDIEIEEQTGDVAFDPFGSLPEDDKISSETADTETADAGADTADINAIAGLGSIDEPSEDDAAETGFTVVDAAPLAPPIMEESDAFDTAFSEPETDSAVPDASIDEDPSLSGLLDEGVLPIAPAPEDTSYLDDETGADADIDAPSVSADTFDLPGVPPVSESPDDFNFPEADDTPFGETEGQAEEQAAGEAFDGGDAAAESALLKNVPGEFKQELRTVLSYMDILLESLPEEKIEEFARSEHFEPYKKLFKELGLV
jgi:hypothetical protein